MQLLTFQNTKLLTLHEWLLPASRSTTGWICRLYSTMLGG